MTSVEDKEHLKSKYDKLSKLCDELKSVPCCGEYLGKIDEILSLSYSFDYMEEYRRIISNRRDKIKGLKRNEAKQKHWSRIQDQLFRILAQPPFSKA